ncbi:TIGR02677 family protein [Nocardia sp. NPDC057668]|uniref:TIGR02677 family protein n=1 Tax=Nocardia sp. NPDC057668 TaxID=3346202 RepID=UPI0036724878
MDLFRYLTAEERVDYIAIMTRFTASLLADMSASTVAEQLAEDGSQLDADTAEVRCRQLVKWGNLVPSLRDSRVSTVADYLRARSRYQVSGLGGRVHRTAMEIMEASDGAREVARELLGQIAQALGEIRTLLDAPVTPERAERLAGLVTTIFNNQRLFTASVTDFYAYLSGVLTRFDLQGQEYKHFKTLLLDYIDLITADVNRHAPLIAERLDQLIERIDELLAVLDAVPGLTLGDVTTVERSSGRTRVEWEQLRQWYDGTGSESGPAQLRAAASQALGQLLANAKRMLDASATGYSRRADLLRLAVWLDRSADAEAERLFAAAFGTWSARHLMLGPDEPDPRVGPMTSWATADPIDVPVSLRDRGNRVARGRTARVPDTTTDRALVEAAARAERERGQAAAAELAAAGRLDGASLSPDARTLLLDELARLLATNPDPATTAETTNYDLGVVLRAAPGAGTVVHCPDGTLTVAGYTLSVRAIASGAAPSLGLAQ